MCSPATDWERCIEFHGHECPGLLIGYKVSEIALSELNCQKSEDEELFVIVENDSCSVDAIQVLCGCTFGKGNLIFKNHGKQVFTFGRRSTGEAIRIAVNSGVVHRDDEHIALMQKVLKEPSTKEERRVLENKNHDLYHHVMDMPTNEFCKLEKITFYFPDEAKVYKSVTCEICGEAVMESKVCNKDGKSVCIPCNENAS